MTSWESDTNERAFAALLSGKKKVEIRANTPDDPIDWSKVSVGDELFLSVWPVPTNNRILAKVVRVAHYRTAYELFMAEGIQKTSSSNPESIAEAVERIYGFTGYKEAISRSGVFAVELADIQLIGELAVSS